MAYIIMGVGSVISLLNYMMRNSTLFYNARFYTGRTQAEYYKYMLVEDGRIKQLSDSEPDSCLYKKKVDLGGLYAYPCLIDAHTHLLYSIINAAIGFDVCEIKGKQIVPDTMEGIEDRLRKFAASKKKNEIVMANNCIPSAIDELRLPTRQELDEWCGGRAAVIYTIDGHASALSSAMLNKIGIEPEGHSGVLTGEAHDRVQGKLTDAVSSAITLSVLARGIANVQNNCAAYGISHIGALDGNGDSEKDLTTSLLVYFARRMSLQVRIYFQYFNADRVARFRKYQLHPRLGGCGEWEMDGATGAHSSSFYTPFKDTGKTAPCYYSQQQVNAAVEKADKLGYQIACHAIGECAIERIASAFLNTSSGRFHRLEHGEFFNADCFEKYKTKRFAVIMQPGYAWIDKHFLHSYEQFLEPEIIERLRFKSLYDAGVCVCASSDSPVQSMNPYEQMLGMTDFYIPRESVSMYEAFRCYTINPAKAIEEENNIGSLEVGKIANFFVSEKELFSQTPDTISTFSPSGTYYSGKLCKQKKGTIGELLRMILTIPHKV